MLERTARYSALFLLATLLLSCATTPQVQVERPWTRTLGQSSSIETGSTVHVDVAGEEKHLILDNSLMDRRIANIVKEQLKRRNFDIVSQESKADYLMKVRYQSEDIQVMKTQLASYQSGYQKNVTGAGYGVLAALAVGAQTSSNQSATSAQTSSQTAYSHTLGFTIVQDDDVVWTGESNWQSSYVDISNRATSVTQILLSDLPGYGEVTPRVKAVNPDKMENYFDLYISGHSFAGPALPYIINFESSTQSISREPEIEGVSNPRILHAVVDLIETAEYALPMDPDFEDPLSSDQWAKVKLGGEYYIGEDQQKTHIIVELRGDKGGYTIDDARAVSSQQYQSFKNNLRRWQNALKTYFEVFE